MVKSIIILTLATFYISAQASTGFYEDAIKYLASDKLEGRKPGTNGNKLAADYSIKKMQSFGLKKFAGSYEQEFTIFTKMIKTGDNFLKSKFDSEVAFQPISSSLSGELENAAMAFVGYGISIPKNDPKLKYDDYAGIDVKDKIVVILTGDPAIGNMKSPFRHPDYISYRSIYYKLKNAVMHGAKAVIIIENPLSIKDYPQEPNPIFNASEGGGNRFSTLAGYATNKWVNNKLKRLKTTTLELQNKIRVSGKPASMEMNGQYSMAINLKKKTGRVSNIVGVLPGQHSTLKKEVVIIGAHFDHIGHGGDSSMDPHGHGKIHNGADDNASGTAMVLKLAKELSKKYLNRTYIFILFNAEESGLLGSAHFADMWQRHGEEYGEMKAMFNFDMVGRYNNAVSVMGTATSKDWEALITPLKSTLKFEQKKSSLGSSDHASFIAKKVPALFITTGAHADYHRSTDTAEKIAYSTLPKIEAYALDLIANLERVNAPTFNPDYSSGDGDGRQRGYGAHLGCVPEFGQSDDIVGVLCVRASDKSPAMKAGIVAGDILIQIGDIEIKTIYDLAFALKYYRAGDKVELGWKRKTQIIKSMITLAKSKRH
jgi:hypothetical protein